MVTKQFCLEYMFSVEGRTLIFEGLNGSIKLAYLVPDLLFDAVNVPFIVLDLNFHLRFEALHILCKESIDDSTYLPFIYLLSYFGFFHIHV